MSRDIKRNHRKRLLKLGEGGPTGLEPPSSVWQPMIRRPARDELHPTFNNVSEWWQNWRYYAIVNELDPALNPFDSFGQWRVIGISSMDETARHDWRDFQRIKNDIVGPEWEAVELYPAESRLVDPSNRFYLYCFPAQVLRFGMTHRRVIDPGGALAPQRPFGKGKRDGD